jgi:uncharacterized repeat protein (TIGR01451 family)
MLTTNTDQPTSSPKPTKKWSWKAAATVFGLALFFTGALVAVIIVQKQRTPEGPAVPVAPTAPVSEPSATIPVDPAACTLGFTVLGDPSAVTCESKVAYADFLTPTQLSGIDKSKLPQPLTAVLPGTEFVYVISVTSAGATTQDVIVTDDLPSGVEYVPHASNSPGIVTSVKTKIDANLGKFSAAGTKRIQFRAKVFSSTTGTLTNVAKAMLSTAATGGANNPNSCPANTLSVTKPGAVSCTSKKAYTNFVTGVKVDKGQEISANGMIPAGKEFVYALTITASAATQKDVLVTDVLPVGVTYVGNNPSDKLKQSYDPATRTVSVNLRKLGADSLTQIIEFKVKTSADIAVGAFTNTAKVQLAGEAESTAQSCAVALTIPPRGTASCEKRAITNFTSKNGVGVNNSIVQRGNVFVYQIKVLASEQTTGGVKLLDTLPAGIEFMEDPDNTPNLIVSADKRSISMELGELGTTTANKTTTIEFKVKVADTATGTLKNTVAVTTGTSTTAYECNQSVVVQQVGSPPAPGCNEACKVNADCSNSAHICYTIADGTGRCRLDTNATNESCNAPTAPGTPSVPVVPGQPAPAQPTLPEELPVAGAEDWANWLKAGLLTLGAGAILLLLL